MKEFTESLGFIVAFMTMTIFMSMFTNETITNGFLMIVLASMLVLNSEKFTKMLDGVMK
ncbi:Uncharacterised protein [Streptococcus pneumoniae]|nr:Uncharacterised protein [Streptococcus pneumoniae]CKF49608.1 Uncharacterised protein [Bacillus paranthracis]CKE78533.1 Uncharacterised protein [Streptococcus pneumoniae]CKE88149.1 Uncharacterised protein [Streptococcus pneumoniae]CKF08320.1 Uncharacterised protein [Streptococcus pneumoniae]